jgi:hypothetical protein
MSHADFHLKWDSSHDIVKRCVFKRSTWKLVFLVKDFRPLLSNSSLRYTWSASLSDLNTNTHSSRKWWPSRKLSLRNLSWRKEQEEKKSQERGTLCIVHFVSPGVKKTLDYRRYTRQFEFIWKTVLVMQFSRWGWSLSVFIIESINTCP